jgi:hypothetical protein
VEFAFTNPLESGLQRLRGSVWGFIQAAPLRRGRRCRFRRARLFPMEECAWAVTADENPAEKIRYWDGA